MQKNLGEMALEDYIKENKRKEKFQKKGLQGTRPSKTLLVSSLNLEVSEVDLFKHFSEKGPLIECSLKKDQFGRSMGKAKVTFDRLEDSEKAFKELNGVEYKGQVLQLKYFSEQKPQDKSKSLSNSQSHHPSNRNFKINKDHNFKSSHGARPERREERQHNWNDRRNENQQRKDFRKDHKRHDSRRK